VAVCDPDTVAARQLSAELEANWFSSAEELLAGGNADAVVVSTPHHTHKPLTILAAEAGKHIFCEKPMALTADECYDMIEAARRNGVKLMVGHKRRLRPQYAKVAALARAGEMGQPVAINISGWHWEEWWGRWWTRKESCGGTLHAGGAHDIDYMRFILGEVDWVYAVQGPTPGINTDYADIIAVVLRFGSGAVGSLQVSFRYPFRTFLQAFEMQIICENGAIAYQPDSRQLEYQRIGGPRRTISYPDDGFEIAWRRELVNFIEWIRGEEEPLLKAEDAVKCVEVMEAAYLSARTGQPVKLPLADSARPGGGQQ